MKVHEHDETAHRLLAEELARPSLYDEAIAYLSRELGEEPPAPQLGAPHQADDAVQARWKRVYQNVDGHWSLYELAEKLVDLEDYFRRWRFNHVTTVERVIGFKRGTGGTAGVSYLRKMLEVELFPELWNLRGEL